jgi:excisionase family DNA binding protein
MKSPDPNSHGDRLLLLKEVGDELRLLDKAVRHLIYAGQLQAHYMAGRLLRVKRSDLDRFLATELQPT